MIISSAGGLRIVDHYLWNADIYGCHIVPATNTKNLKIIIIISFPCI